MAGMKIGSNLDRDNINAIKMLVEAESEKANKLIEKREGFMDYGKEYNFVSIDDPTFDQNDINLLDDKSKFFEARNNLVDRSISLNPDIGMDRSNYVAHDDVMSDLMDVSNKQLRSAEKLLNLSEGSMSLVLRSSSATPDRASMFMNIDVGSNVVKTISMPFVYGANSTLGNEVKVGFAGAVIDAVDGIPIATTSSGAAKVIESTLVPYNQLVMSNFIKVLGDSDKWLKDEVGDSIKELKSIFGDIHARTYSVAASSPRTISGVESQLESIHEISEARGIVIEALQNKNLDIDDKFRLIKRGLGDSQGGVYKSLNGINEADANRLGEEVVEKNKDGKWILRQDPKHYKKLNADTRKQYDEYVRSKYMKAFQKSTSLGATQGSHTGESNISPAFDKGSHISGKQDVLNYGTRFTDMSVKDKLGVWLDDTVDELHPKIQGKTHAVKLKTIMIHQGIPSGYMEYIGSSKLVNGRLEMSPEELAVDISRWRNITNSPEAKTSNEILSNQGLPTKGIQADSQMILHKKFDQDSLTKDVAEIMSLRRFTDDNKVFVRNDKIVDGDIVKEGDVIGAIHESGDTSKTIIEQITATESGKITYRDGKTVVIMKQEGLRTGLVMGEGITENKVTPTSGGHSLMDNPLVKSVGSDQGAGFSAVAIVNSADIKTPLGEDHVYVAKNKDGTFTSFNISDQRTGTRTTTSKSSASTKIKGQDQKAKVAMREAVSNLDDIFRAGGSRNGDQVHRNAVNILRSVLDSSGDGYTDADLAADRNRLGINDSINAESNSNRGLKVTVDKNEHSLGNLDRILREVGIRGRERDGFYQPSYRRKYQSIYSNTLRDMKEIAEANGIDASHVHAMEQVFFKLEKERLIDLGTVTPPSPGASKEEVDAYDLATQKANQRVQDLDNAKSHLDASRIAVATAKLRADISPNSAFHSNFRYANIDMARILLDPTSGVDHYNYRHSKTIVGNEYRKIFQGAMISNSVGTGIRPSTLIKGLRDAGLMSTVTSGGENSSKTISNLSKINELFKSSTMAKYSDEDYERLLAESYGEGKISLKGRSTSHSLTLKFGGNAKSQLNKALENSGGIFTDADRAIARNLIDSGMNIVSNTMLGRNNSEAKWNSSFMESRTENFEAVLDLMRASDGDSVDMDALQVQLRATVNSIATTRLDISAEMSEGDLIKKAMSGEFDGLYGLSTVPMKSDVALEGAEELAEEAGTVRISKDKYRTMYGVDYDPEKQKYAIVHREPSLVASMDVVAKVVVDNRIDDGQIGINTQISDLMKADHDNDPISLLRLGDSDEDRRLSDSGFKRLTKLLTIQRNYVNNVQSELENMVAAKNLAEANKYHADVKEVLAAQMKADSGLDADKKAWQKVQISLNEKYGSDWSALFSSSHDKQKRIGQITNKLGEMNAMISAQLQKDGAFDSTLKGTTVIKGSPEANLLSRQRNLLALGSAMGFAGEAIIRSSKKGAADAVGKALSLEKLVSDMMEIKGENEVNSAETAKMTKSVMNSLGRVFTESEIDDTSFNRVLRKHKSEIKGKHVLLFGKTATVSEDFLELADEIGKKGSGLYVISEKKVGDAVSDLMKIANSDDEGIRFSRDVMKVLMDKHKDADDVLRVIMSAGFRKDIFDYITLGQEEMLMVATGLTKDDLARKSASEKADLFESSEKYKEINKDKLKMRIQEQAENRLAQKTKAGEGVVSKLTDKIYGAGRMDFGKGLFAGAVAATVGAMVGGLAGGAMEAPPLPPQIPLGASGDPAMVTSIPGAPSYLMDKTAISNRMNISGSMSPNRFLGAAAASGSSAYISINDRSLNDAEYLSQYQNRASGRF